MKTSIIGRGTPIIVSRYMPTQEETIAAMELLRMQISPPTSTEGQVISVKGTETEFKIISAEASHDPLSGHMTKTKTV